MDKPGGTVVTQPGGLIPARRWFGPIASATRVAATPAGGSVVEILDPA